MGLVKSTNGAFSFHDIMNMELADFNEVLLELNISDSADRFENQRINNHENAVRNR